MASTIPLPSVVSAVVGGVDHHQHSLQPNRRIGAGSPYALDHDDPVDGDAMAETLHKRVLFDGVFKGSYSLALVNRCLAKALTEAGVDLACYTPEADWQSDAALGATPEIKARLLDNYPGKGSFDIHLRNTWPATTADMVGRLNAYVCFAWEETELPPHLVERFNRDLDLIMVTSHFVCDAFRHSGVRIPIAVVGNGCDHALGIDHPSPIEAPTGDRARILHVSSGFPRKGPDLLIEAYRRAFRRDDPVELVVKTFANPDNVVPATLARQHDDQLPLIRVVEADHAYEALIGLYKSAAMIVAPSRGEGFGLPLAEAMLLGIPVVTTNYSGQLDFCRPDTAWLVDYTLSPSRAHVASAFSVWADASIDHLAQQMRAVLDQPEEARARCERAKQLLQTHFTWAKVAARVIKALVRIQRPHAVARAHTAWTMDIATAWQQRCGIATYAQHLYGTPALAPRITSIFGRRVLDDALPPDPTSDADPRLSRVWGFDLASLMRLAKSFENAHSDVLWLQHHPGHFSNPDMDILAGALRRSPYRVRAITLHNVREAHRAGPIDWIRGFDVAFVHSAEDAAILSAAGHTNTVVVPHGFLPTAVTDGPGPDPDHFTIGSFGFLNPHKNVDGLLIAFAQARRFEPRLRLRIFNCVQEHDFSRLQRALIENLVQHFGLHDCVESRFDFIAEEELIGALATCDLLAFPYGPSNETATGAARIGMSADRPILCSRSSVLHDLWPFSHVLRSNDLDCLTEALVALAQNPDLLSLHDHERRRAIAWHSYPRVAERCAFHIEKFSSETHEHSRAA